MFMFGFSGLEVILFIIIIITMYSNLLLFNCPGLFWFIKMPVYIIVRALNVELRAYVFVIIFATYKFA